MSEPRGAETVHRYHERSTHHPGRYARGPGLLDWANQPEPFRFYAGAPRVPLPLAGDDVAVSWGDLHRPGSVFPRPLDRASLGSVLELALGITAWKEHGGARWALRANPSSGNLHPTEGYLLVAGAGGVPAGLHHYLSRDHVLERRWTPPVPEALAGLLPPGVFVLGFASIHWREAWKYGERAFRYCQHDVGHALGAVRYAAAALGWSARLLETPGDDDVAALLGLDREGDSASLAPGDREHPDGLVVVAPAGEIDAAARRVEEALGDLIEALRGGTWSGEPNALSPEHVDWPAIAEVATATAKPRTSLPSSTPPGAPLPAVADRPSDARSAVGLVRGRRSAVAMDAETGLPSAAFFALLDRLVPRPGTPPWDVLPWSPARPPRPLRPPGRRPGARALSPRARPRRARGSAQTPCAGRSPGAPWKAVPESLSLFLLEAGDTRSLARLASCHQEIASDSAFAVAMLADVGALLAEGPWWYRWLHWEAGLLGHVLYLEAEAAGLRGTGIGCFFDDVVHETLGLGDDRFRDLYHFTVGGAVEDPRLTTHPGYDAEVGRRT